MPSSSDSQRRLFQMVAAYKRGKLKNPSAEIQQVASTVTKQQAGDFAGAVEPDDKKKKKRFALASSLTSI